MTTTSQPQTGGRDGRTDGPDAGFDRWTRFEIAMADAVLAAALFAVALAALAATTGDPELLVTVALVGVGVTLLGMALLRVAGRVRGHARSPRRSSPAAR